MQQSPETSAERARAYGLLAAALSLGVALRAHALGALSLYYDELYATRIHGLSPRNVAGVVARTAFYDQHPPLYYLSALAWTQLFGISEAGVRGLSVVAGALLIPAVYLLGRDLSGRRTGAWGALVTAVFPLLVYYSREARMYAQLALLATLSTWLLVRLARGDRSRWLLPAWVVASAGAALTHYFGAVHVFAEFVALALRGRRGARSLPAWLCLFAAPLAAFAPFALFARYQAGHFDSSYLGFGAGVYVDVLAWLGAAHQHLPVALAWTVPAFALAALGVRASWREQAPEWTSPFAAPPPSSPYLKALATLTGVGSLLVAAAIFAVRARLTDKVASVEVDRGESQAIAALQGHTAVTAALAGAAVAAFALFALAARDAIGARLSRDAPPKDDALDAAGSLPRVALVCIAIPLGLSLVAGLAGKPLVLVRNFITAAPFIALLIARGLVSLPPLRRGLAAAALGVVSLFAASRFGALPGLAPDDPRPWVVHTYHDWRTVASFMRADQFRPVVVLQHYATDTVIHYRDHHPVLRVREDGERLVVAQVRQDDDFDVEVREGDAFHPDLITRFYVIDVTGLPREHGVSRRILNAARAGHACDVAGTVPGGVTVYDCSASEALADAR